jgi:NhaP-type Na+/H+ and K+/H+ antiporter
MITDCVGKTIIELQIYKDVVINSIIRKGKIIPPKGNVELQNEDILFILAPVKLIKPIAALLNKGHEKRGALISDLKKYLVIPDVLRSLTESKSTRRFMPQRTSMDL